MGKVAMSQSKVHILSGAGLSAESGIRTFRDTDGLWEEYSIEEVCSVQGWMNDRKKVSDFYDARRADLESKVPNEAHKVLASLKEKYGSRVVMLTQNVDDMLERAGCADVIHLHGTLTDLRCEACDEVFHVGHESQEGKTCPKCSSEDIRHNVVMFGEAAPAYEHLRELYNNGQMVAVIGTSGQVIDTAYIAQLIENSVILNLDIDENIDQFFKTRIYEKATVGIHEVVELIEDFLE
jgi:NAD-dependent deacetylase